MSELLKRTTEETFAKRFQQLLKEKKEASGLTLRELAKDLDVSLGILSDWQNGKKIPRMDSVIHLAQYFNVTTDYLLGLTDVRTTDSSARAASELTGLWEQSINKLTELKHEGETETPEQVLIGANRELYYINKFIQSGTLLRLAHSIVSLEKNITVEARDEIYIEKLKANRYDEAFYPEFQKRYFKPLPPDLAEKIYKEHFPNEEAFKKWVDTLSEDALVSGLRGRFPGSTDDDFARYSELDRYMTERTLQHFMDEVAEETVNIVKEAQRDFDEHIAKQKGDSHGADNEENE